METSAMRTEVVGEPTARRTPAREVRRRPRTRRLITISGLLALFLAGWKAAPGIKKEIRFRLAEREIAHGQYEDAEARLALLISEDPRQTRPRLLRVKILRRQGQITEAEETLQRTVELGLTIEEARREHLLLRAGAEFSRVEKSLRQILETHPDDDEVRQALNEGLSRARP